MTTEPNAYDLSILAEINCVFRENCYPILVFRFRNIMQVAIQRHYIISQHPTNRSNWRLKFEREEMKKGLHRYNLDVEDCHSDAKRVFDDVYWYDVAASLVSMQNSQVSSLRDYAKAASCFERELAGTEMYLSKLEQKLRDHIYPAKPTKRVCRKRRI